MEVPVSIVWMIFVLLFFYFGAYLIDSKSKNKDEVFSQFVFVVVLGVPLVSSYLIVPILDMLILNKESSSIEEAHIMNPLLYTTIFAIANAFVFFLGYTSDAKKRSESTSNGLFGGFWNRRTQRRLREKELEVEKIREQARLQESLNEEKKLENEALGQKLTEMNSLTKRKLFNEKILQHEKHIEALESLGKNLEAANMKAKIEELKRKAAEAGIDLNL